MLQKLKRAIKSKLGYFPTKVYTDVKHYSDSCDDNQVKSIEKITSSEVFNLELPKFSNVALPDRFDINHFKLVPESYFAEIDNCTVGMVDFRVGVITEDNGLILDLSPDHAKKNIHPFLSHYNCKPQYTLKGKTLVLAAPAGKGNYYHWMFHVMGRLSVLKCLEIDLDSFDHVIVNKTFAKFQENALVDFGIDAKKITYIDNDQFVKVECGFYPSYLYFNRMVPHFLKRHYLKGVNINLPSTSKTYISRRNSSIRKLLNEEELVDFLVGKCGYKEVFMEDYSIQEQAVIMNNSSHVVTPHGAGVPNIIYCKAGTQILEILPYTWINVIYWIYAEFQALNYGVYMAGEETEEANGYTDYSVELDKFQKFIKENGY